MNIYVGNLPFSATDEDLKNIFSEYGKVESAKVIIDRETGRSKGFGFVEMESETAAQQAIEGLNNKPFNQRNLTVNEARPPQRDSFDRRGGGGGGGGGRGGYGGGGGRSGGGGGRSGGGGGRSGGGGRY